MTIIDDDEAEGTEFFSATISLVSDVDVELEPSLSSVSIEDNDQPEGASKCMHTYVHV